MENQNLEIRKMKAKLVKQLYQESFYGILGTHPKATKKDIEKGFKIKLKSLKDKHIGTILKAYATLTSSYKENYDEYLKKYEEGLESAIDELASSNGDLAKKFGKYLQPWATKIQPWAVFMQPWSTSSK